MARKQSGLTQVQVGEALGVTDKAVSNWERDVVKLEAEHLIKLSRLLQVSAAWIWDGGAPPPLDVEGLSLAERQAVDSLIEVMRAGKARVA